VTLWVAEIHTPGWDVPLGALCQAGFTQNIHTSPINLYDEIPIDGQTHISIAGGVVRHYGAWLDIRGETQNGKATIPGE